MTYQIQAQDRLGHWEDLDDGEFATEAVAQAALANLVETTGWDRNRLRVVTLPDRHPTG